MPLVTLNGLSYATPDGRTLFEDLTLAFGAERTGLVGRNGVGKSTLLSLMLGEIAPTTGSVGVLGRLGVLRQTFSPPLKATVAEVLGLDEPLARLARIETGAGTEADFDAADWTLEARLAAAFAQVGLAGLDPRRPAGSLSGGQATRAALAGLLTVQPDMLLLDEPTNNLDADARALVADVLAGWKGGAVVISHDRDLLRAMDRIVDLTSLGAKVYGGNFDVYAQRKAEEEDAAVRDLAQAERAVAQAGREAQVAREKKARRDAAGRRAAAKGDAPKVLLGARAERAENTGARGNLLAQRQAAEAGAELADAQGRVERLRRLALELPSCGLPAGKSVLAFDEVGFAWPGGAPLLAGVSFRMSGPRRLAVTGSNGSGKSTLIRLAVGDLSPTLGTVTRAVRAALLDQRTAMLRDDETLVEAFRRLNPNASDNAARGALATFLFRNVAADKRVGALSGGERL
ncbi:ATP-binding cassette domain-containing protein, partial [Phenylobacterium sp.]|uniref:ATP-binding cassette domain-containing protein n=1 Tax=Phenylobacterium sp. TaxID=1871053 RepID=UPI00286B10BF